MSDRFPEPPDGSHVLVGEAPRQVLLIRDDASADAMRDVDPGLVEEIPWWPETYRWWRADCGDGEPLCWSLIVDPDPDPMAAGLPRGLNRKVMALLYTREQLDQAVAEAVARVGARPVGDHLREAGGHCGHCGYLHSPQEWARLEDRLDEGRDPGE